MQCRKRVEQKEEQKKNTEYVASMKIGNALLAVVENE